MPRHEDELETLGAASDDRHLLKVAAGQLLVAQDRCVPRGYLFEELLVTLVLVVDHAVNRTAQ